MSILGDLAVRIVGNFAELEKGIANSGKGTGATTAGTTAGTAFTKAAQRSITAAGGVGGAMFVGAVGGATAFEDQLRTINTVAHLTDDELKGVGDSILGLSKETGKSTDDLTAGFYDLVSAGVPANEAIGVLRDSAKFATGALGTTAEAVDVVTSALNAYGLESSQSAKVTDIFAQAVADGKVTAAELGSSIANIAPIASSAGISLEEVSTGFALLTAKGVPAAQAATEMRAAISALLTPNTQLNHLQQQTGINFAALAKEKGLGVALEALRKATQDSAGAMDYLSGVSGKDFPAALKKLGPSLGLTTTDIAKFTAYAGKNGAAAAIAKLTEEVGVGDSGFAKSLGSIEAYQFALQATGAGAGAYAAELGKVTDASTTGGVATGQYEERMKSAKSQGDKMTATFRALAIQIGGPFVESFGPAITALGGLGTGLNGIFNIARLVGGGIGAIGGKLIGLLIPGILSAVAPATVAGETVGAATSAGIVSGTVLLPALLVAALVAAIIFLVNNPEIVDQIAAFAGSFIQNLMDFLATLPQIMADFFVKLVGVVAQRLPALIQTLADIWLSIPGRIIGLYAAVLGLFLRLVAAIAPHVLAFVGEVVRNILSIPGKIAGLVGQVLGVFARIATQAAAKVIGFVGDAVRFYLSIPLKIAALIPQMIGFFANMGLQLAAKVGEFIGNIVKWFLSIPGKIAALGGNIVKAIINGLGSLPGKVADVVRSAFANLRIDIGPFHVSASGVSIDLPHFASGVQNFAGGLALVGERGPELVNLPRGSDVIPNHALDDMTGGGGGITIPISLTGYLPVRGPDDIARPLRQVAQTGYLSRPANPMAVPNG